MPPDQTARQLESTFISQELHSVTRHGRFIHQNAPCPDTSEKNLLSSEVLDEFREWVKTVFQTTREQSGLRTVRLALFLCGQMPGTKKRPSSANPPATSICWIHAKWIGRPN
jgi:hypothetical protein